VVVGPGGVTEDDFGGGALEDNAGEEFIICEFDGVEGEFGCDFAGGMEDGIEDLCPSFIFAGVFEAGAKCASGGLILMALEATEAGGVVQ